MGRLKDMYYIYKYTNKQNGHCYIGQTNNLNRRIREHRSCAFNKKSTSYSDLIHKKIREYGEESFEIEVLEKGESSDQNYINERERYFIELNESFCGTGKGYNRDLGGSKKSEGVLTQEQIKTLKAEILQGVSYYELENKYNISASFISSINHGIYYFDESQTYPLFQYYKKDEDYDELIDLLVNSNLSLSQIAQQLNLGYSTVKKINAGTLRKGLYPSYPIRKINRADRIKQKLLTTNMSVKEIAKEIGCSEETVRRINKGEVYFENKYTYPLRNL